MSDVVKRLAFFFHCFIWSIQNYFVYLHHQTINKNKSMYFHTDKKHYCGKYKGIDVWQYGCMIGNGWYGDFYVTIPRGKTRRNTKVKDSVCRSLESVKDYINRNLESLKKLAS